MPFSLLESSSKLLTGEKKTEDEQHWWHDVKTMKECATKNSGALQIGGEATV
jgi:hypothetical protein